MPKPILLLLTLALTTGCATYPHNPPARAIDPDAGYRYQNLTELTPEGKPNSDELFVVLAFSGGGTRAAALCYGVMEQLRDTTVNVNGRSVRLLDEVDLISSVSGGSFVAAYYAAFGDRIFEDFESKFLKHDVQGELLSALGWPGNWARFASFTYGRSDLADEYYNRDIFEGKTYADVLARNRRPYVILNATDMTLGMPFQFTQDQFDLIGSDLTAVPLSRAVAASSAVPLLMSPVTFVNHPKPKGFTEPEWIARSLNHRHEDPRRFPLAQQARTYLEDGVSPFIHLLDGGVIDNLGVEPLTRMNSLDPEAGIATMIDEQKLRRMVVIMVNAVVDRDLNWARNPSPPGNINVLLAGMDGMMNARTRESAAFVWERVRMAEQVGATNVAEVMKGENPQSPPIMIAPREIDYHVIEVDFEGIQDPKERHKLARLPTSFVLWPNDIDRLKTAARKVLVNAEGFKELLRETAGSYTLPIDEARLAQ
ncbi:MAG: patatin-like phospholipase family protein [Planctomycetota bacterium]|jgi:predicted acylesterase/phospholipase RssA